MSSSRLKFACNACTRRKVKCSKTIPCNNCVRRGEQETCSNDAERTHVENEDSPSSSTPASASEQELGLLRSRLQELENQLTARDLPLTLESSNDSRTRSSPHVNHHATGPQNLRPNHIAPAQEFEHGADDVAKNAASILEFLAWGKRIQPGPDYGLANSPEASAKPGNVGDASDSAANWSNYGQGVSPEISQLQLLLPSKRQLLELVKYHEENLLWYHGSYFAPAFDVQLKLFQERFHGEIDGARVNLQWLALLFAVIAGTMTCAPEYVAYTWGFKAREREILSKKWLRAVYTCLDAAEYSANQSILSVQAVATLTISAHLLGFSNVHSIRLAAAIRIAQSLGLHRIRHDTSNTIEQETTRRLWAQLCCQDWFSIPFSETYLINPLHSTSEPPMNCHDDLVPLPDDCPTSTTYCRILLRIASIMPRLQDDILAHNTPFTRYEQVLKWDKRMRDLSTTERPSPFSNMPLDPTWPKYVLWARSSLAISSAHKIIMIHRSFLSDSFTNPAFSFTRRTCCAAAKTIIREYKKTMEKDDGEPTFWIHQAFSVAASIILLLDMLHRHHTEPEYNEHKQLVEDTLTILQTCSNSMIAQRGLKLLSALLNEICSFENMAGQKRTFKQMESQSDSGTLKRHGTFSVADFVKVFCADKAVVQPVSHAQSSGNSAHLGFNEVEVTRILPDTNFHTSNAVDTNYGATSSMSDISFGLAMPDSLTTFDNLMYLANNDFTF